MEQENPTEGLELDLEDVSAKEFAYHMTMFDWELFWNIHEVIIFKGIHRLTSKSIGIKLFNYFNLILKYELLYHTFGRHRYGQSTANLDVFLRRFNEVQYWVVTELCSTQSLSKRVQILRKIIKIAS